LDLGNIEIEKMLREGGSSKEQNHVIFDTTSRAEGVESSDDTFLDAKANVCISLGKKMHVAEDDMARVTFSGRGRKDYSLSPHSSEDCKLVHTVLVSATR
jgi:hypothetical protein